MEYESLTTVFKTLIPIGIGAGLLFLLISWIRLELLTYKNEKAPVETSRAQVYSKDPEVGILPQGRASSSVHHVTFHTEAGNIVTLYMGPRDYYAMEEGDWGTLTWQGSKFWSFIHETT